MTHTRTDYMWRPSVEEWRGLMWSVFPEEIGEMQPIGFNTSPPRDIFLTHTIPVRMGPALAAKLSCFGIETGLDLPELIRRLLESEVFLHGEFDVAARYSGPLTGL